MTAKYQQIALNDIFSDFQSKLIDNYPLSLFFFQNTLISMNLFHPSSIRLSGFSKVPDTSLLSRFKHNFDAYIELMFQSMVDHTEPICQLIHVSLSQTSIVIPLSIHSTTQVETILYMRSSRTATTFNPLHHTGGDELFVADDEVIDAFNPLHHTGGDTPPFLHNKTTRYFQSTPPHRWRLQGISDHRGEIFFQSTPPHRWRRQKSDKLIDRRGAFNPLHHTGGDGSFGIDITLYHAFNPLHHTGGDRGGILMPGGEADLSIHSTTQVETAISYNIIQDFLLISNKLTIISYIYHQFLLHILSITIPFCIFFWCESPWNFMFA